MEHAALFVHTEIVVGRWSLYCILITDSSNASEECVIFFPRDTRVDLPSNCF